MNDSSLDILLSSLRSRPIVTIAFSCLCGIGLIANCLIVAVIAYRRNYRTSTYILIASIATSDALCCAGLIAYNVTSIFLLYPNNMTTLEKEIFCDVTGVSIYTNYYVSTHTLVIMSVDRYYAFVKIPYKALLYTKRRIFLAIALAWIFGFLVAFPQIFISGIDPSFPYICDAVDGHSIVGEVYYSCVVVAEEILPALLIIYAYVHVIKAIKESSSIMRNASENHMSKRNMHKRQMAVNKIIVVTTVFLVLTAIIHITRLMVSLTDATVINLYMKREFTLAAIVNVFYAIAFIQPIVNPIMFCIMSKSFRKKIFRLEKRNQSMTRHISMTYITNN